MATYLLKADDEVMTHWRAVAKDRGVTFAEFVRTAIEAEIAHPSPVRHAGEMPLGKVFKGMDPKPVEPPKKKRW